MSQETCLEGWSRGQTALPDRPTQTRSVGHGWDWKGTNLRSTLLWEDLMHHHWAFWRPLQFQGHRYHLAATPRALELILGVALGFRQPSPLLKLQSKQLLRLICHAGIVLVLLLKEIALKCLFGINS